MKCVHCSQPLERSITDRWRHVETGRLMCRVNGFWMLGRFAEPEVEES